jgi:hypothetical protein
MLLYTGNYVFIYVDCGHLVSFKGGSLVHGGDPILQGTRYIVAAFLYIESGDTPSLASEILRCSDEWAEETVEEIALAPEQASVKKKRYLEAADKIESTFSFNFSIPE